MNSSILEFFSDLLHKKETQNDVDEHHEFTYYRYDSREEGYTGGTQHIQMIAERHERKRWARVCNFERDYLGRRIREE